MITGGVVVKIMLDIGSAVSLLRHREVNSMNTQLSLQGCFSIQLVTALRESLLIIGCVEAHVQMTHDFKANHQFLIVDSLIYPVILGTDFLYMYHLCLDFASLPVAIQHNISDLDSVQPLWDATVEAKAKRYTTATIVTVLEHNIVEECSIPLYDKSITYRTWENFGGRKFWGTNGVVYIFRTGPNGPDRGLKV